jgi:hypothetical protein
MIVHTNIMLDIVSSWDISDINDFPRVGLAPVFGGLVAI